MVADQHQVERLASAQVGAQVLAEIQVIDQTPETNVGEPFLRPEPTIRRRRSVPPPQHDPADGASPTAIDCGNLSTSHGPFRKRDFGRRLVARQPILHNALCFASLLHRVKAAARVRSVDGDDLVGLVARDELVAGLRDVQHLFEAHAELVELAVLGFECERHTGLDLDRMVQ